MNVLSKEDNINAEDRILVRKDSYNFSSSTEHFHDFLEIVYITSGTATHLINGKAYNAQIGDVYMLDFSDKHTFDNKSDDFTIVTCAFLPELIDDSLVESHDAQDILKLLLFQPFFEANGGLRFSMNISQQGKAVSNIFEEMTSEFNAKEEGYRAVLKGYLMILLSKIFRIAIKTGSKKENNYQREIIDKAIDFLQKNYSKPFNIDEIAKVVLLSPSYFSTIFKSQTGTSITDFTQKIRISKACELLSATNKTVDEIMNDVGYNDSKFFYRIFKRHTGMTPGAYKRQYKKDG